MDFCRCSIYKREINLKEWESQFKKTKYQIYGLSKSLEITAMFSIPAFLNLNNLFSENVYSSMFNIFLSPCFLFFSLLQSQTVFISCVFLWKEWWLTLFSLIRRPNCCKQCSGREHPISVTATVQGLSITVFHLISSFTQQVNSFEPLAGHRQLTFHGRTINREQWSNSDIVQRSHWSYSMAREVVSWLCIYGAGYRTVWASAEYSLIAFSRNQDQKLQIRGIDIW